MKDTPEYKEAVLRGKPVFREPDFIGSPEDNLTVAHTPVGQVEVLYLAEREDFVHAMRALAYRCEPVAIPESVGASTIQGLINWEKIRAHKAEYLTSGGTDWPQEFKRFTENRRNYQDTIILLSAGPYSAVPADEVGLSRSDWLQKSLTIRKYHELTHFVCRERYPNDVDAVRDEVIADAIGLLAAFGYYNPELALRLLGIQNGELLPGGRLEHYVPDEKLKEATIRCAELVRRYDRYIADNQREDVLSLLSHEILSAVS